MRYLIDATIPLTITGNQATTPFRPNKRKPRTAFPAARVMSQSPPMEPPWRRAPSRPLLFPSWSNVAFWPVKPAVAQGNSARLFPTLQA
jgi:hypothetical protein